MAVTPTKPDNTEAMAFELILQKVTGLERAMASLPPLLQKIIDQLEAQGKQPEVEVASYAQLYPELEGEDGAETPPVQDVPAPAGTPVPRRPAWRWFLRER